MGTPLPEIAPEERPPLMALLTLRHIRHGGCPDYHHDIYRDDLLRLHYILKTPRRRGLMPSVAFQIEGEETIYPTAEAVASVIWEREQPRIILTVRALANKEGKVPSR